VKIIVAICSLITSVLDPYICAGAGSNGPSPICEKHWLLELFRITLGFIDLI
jgi:hypothetical protein